jgi:hypothetical protein
MYPSSITIIPDSASEPCERMSNSTELKRTEWRAPLASEERGYEIREWKLIEEACDEQTKKGKLEFEQKLSQNGQNRVRAGALNIAAILELRKAQIPRIILVRDVIYGSEDVRCLSCERPVESHSEEHPLCACCGQVPNLFLG